MCLQTHAEMSRDPIKGNKPQVMEEIKPVADIAEKTDRGQSAVDRRVISKTERDQQHRGKDEEKGYWLEGRAEGGAATQQLKGKSRAQEYRSESSREHGQLRHPLFRSRCGA